MERQVYKKIARMDFGVLGPKEIKKMAVAKVVTPELYDKEGYPVDGGLMDIRLGVIDPGLRCKTCGEKLKECGGHFGYIELARPIIHIKYVRIIMDFLRATCRECSRILLEDKGIEKYRALLETVEKTNGLEARRKKVRELINSIKNVKKCPHCKIKQFPVKLEKPSTFTEADKRVTPIQVRTRFEKIPDGDVEMLGLNPKYARPDWLVLTVLLIPPVTMRPSITLETGERSEDDLTHKLGDVVRINQRLFENINAGAPEIIVEDLWDLLQYHITTYFDNTVTQIPPARHRSGQLLKTLTERIRSKEGRFRYNLAGKRVNFAARTVISPDPEIGLNEVGIPLSVAMDITVPERVTEWNMKRLKEFIKKGPTNYPGSNYVIRPDGKKKKITDETREQLIEELQPGYVVERHLMDGDTAIFNRQPSLHKMSIMCHKIRIIPGKSFRLNPHVCVAPDTNVQLSSGIQRPIDELKNCWKESELLTIDRKDQKLFSTDLKEFWAIKPEAYNVKCYEIITSETNRRVVATGDHPFYTSKGIKRGEELKVKDKVIVRPLDTPVYKEVDKQILSEEDIRKVAPKETYIKHSLKIIKDLMLLPLNLIDQRTMTLARLLGHLFGDGTFILKKDTARLIFRGSKEDLEFIQNDIKSLGFNPEKIFVKTAGGVIHTIKGKVLYAKGSYPCFEVRNKPLALLFAALGAPNGDKVKLSYSVPKWIKESPLHIKREFIAAYFGCELTALKIRDNSKSNFKPLIFKLSKVKEKIDRGYKFINDLGSLLDAFGIKIGHISEEEGNIRKDGSLTHSLAAMILDNKSILNLLGKIGYIYNRKRDDTARMAYQYLILKEKELKIRKEKYKKFFDLRNKGYKFNQISKKLNVSIRVLESWSYSRKTASIPAGFIGFHDWLNGNNAGSGLVYETIKDIKEVYCPFVYDVTTVADTHNFFANGFLSKNCFPYNADFDGDEMNLHIPQTEEAIAEADVLMQVQTQIITPKNGLNVIGVIEDSISGCYLLTKEMTLKKEDAIGLLISIGIDSGFEKFKSTVVGRDVFSVLLPEDFNFVGETKSKQPLVIKKGKIVEGHIDVNAIGEEKGALIREIYKRYGPTKTLEVIDKIAKLGVNVLFKRGFSSSLGDTDLDEELKNKIQQQIDEAKGEVDELIRRYNKGELDALPSRTVEETLEVMILRNLNKIRNKVGDLIATSVKEKNNHTIIMARSGARGNILNLAMMAAVVGQQALRGKRIRNGYDRRTLTLFKKDDKSPKSKGFIDVGFKKGLDPVQFFFGAMTGRDSLMDTALRTPKSGYLYRRLANALQDLKVEYDGTVRDATKTIIQFNYGDDNIDVSKSDGGTIDVKRIVKVVAGED